MIRRLLVLGGLALLARRLLRRGPASERVAIGFADGASVVLEPGVPGHADVIAAAREALLP